MCEEVISETDRDTRTVDAGESHVKKTCQVYAHHDERIKDGDVRLLMGR
jgi:hypothetical protein